MNIKPEKINLYFESLTPNNYNITEYIGQFPILRYKYPNVNMMLGVIIKESKELNDNAPKFKLLRELGLCGFQTATYICGEPLREILTTKNPQDSHVAKQLYKLSKLDKIPLDITNKNIDLLNHNKLWELIVYLGQNTGMPRTGKTIMLPYHQQTSKRVDQVFCDYHRNSDMSKKPWDLGISIFNPAEKTDKYKDFENISKYKPATFMPYVSMMPHVYGGGIKTNNIKQVLEHLNVNANMYDINIGVLGGAHQDGEFFMPRAETFCKQAQEWLQLIR
ncbi:hypothetical protein LJC18_00070 [Lachnospiraceae bacterium OttesenSCG-928-E19]|nr:hypothetical protein [Lachnospiraceae bacterium OttesenSCG-928-E19]